MSSHPCPSPTCEETFQSEAAVARHLGTDHGKRALAGRALLQTLADAGGDPSAAGEDAVERQLYFVRHATYGELRRVKHVTFDREAAIKRARQLASGARYHQTLSDHYECEGYTQAGSDIFQVMVFTVEDPAIDPDAL